MPFPRPRGPRAAAGVPLLVSFLPRFLSVHFQGSPNGDFQLRDKGSGVVVKDGGRYFYFSSLYNVSRDSNPLSALCRTLCEDNVQACRDRSLT